MAIKRILTLFALLTVLASSLAVVTPAAAQGNSEAAHACQKGGWEDLQGTDGTLFANTGECVSFAARGGELQPIPSSIEVSFDPTHDSRYCLIQVDLVRFAPNTAYPVQVKINDWFTYNRTMTTDGNGYASGYPIGSYYNGGTSVRVSSNGITTDALPISCAA